MAKAPIIPHPIGPSVYLFCGIPSGQGLRAVDCLYQFLEERGVQKALLRRETPKGGALVRSEWIAIVVDTEPLPARLALWEAADRQVLEIAVPQQSLRVLGETVSSVFIDLMADISRAIHRCVSLDVAIIGEGAYVAGALLDFWESPSLRPTDKTPGTLWPNSAGGLDFQPLSAPIDLSYMSVDPGE